MSNFFVVNVQEKWFATKIILGGLGTFNYQKPSSFTICRKHVVKRI
jgi:hypothetical protein